MLPPTFVLAVGAPKTGTTWLYSYLNGLPFADFGIKKEYHIFDAIHVPSCEFFKPALDNRDSPPANGFEAKKRQREQLLHGFYSDPENYFDYFAGLLIGDISLTGDVTPTYMLLPQGVFQSIRDGFARRNIAVKVVLFMRDPVARMISLAKMSKKLGMSSGRRFDKTSPLAEIIADLLAVPGMRATFDYPAAINKLRKVFADEEVFIGFYENLFKLHHFQQLCRFLNVPCNPDWLAKKVNASVESPEMRVSPEYRQQLRLQFNDVYQNMTQLYPGNLIADLWQPLNPL